MFCFLFVCFLQHLTYRVDSFTRDLPQEKQLQVFKESFDLWSDVSRLEFEEMNNPSASVHIAISFKKGRHGDGNPFDGPGGTLAHA